LNRGCAVHQRTRQQLLPRRIAHAERPTGDLEKPFGAASADAEGTAMKTTAHLTSVNAELDRQVARTQPGQAHFAETGPFAATCGDCVFWTYWKRIKNASGDLIKTSKSSGCKKFYELTGRHGPALAPGTDACRYFERRESKP
jgi:hypothetical protein